MRGLELIVLDELGYVPFSKARGQLLFEVISHAYEYQSLIVTSNLPFDQWTTIFGCERLTGALLDRLTHRCHIIEADGESYRLRQARRQEKAPPFTQSNEEAEERRFSIDKNISITDHLWTQCHSFLPPAVSNFPPPSTAGQFE